MARSVQFRFRLDSGTVQRLISRIPRRHRLGDALLDILVVALSRPSILARIIVEKRLLPRSISDLRGRNTQRLFGVRCATAEVRTALVTGISFACGFISGRLNAESPIDATTVVHAAYLAWLNNRVHVAALEEPSEKELQASHAWPDDKWTVERVAERHHSKKRRRNRISGTRRTNTRRIKRRGLRAVAAPKARAVGERPHDVFPEVNAEPCAWQPGSRGRPPQGVVRKHGKWMMPQGWREIDGRWHPALPTNKGGPMVSSTIERFHLPVQPSRDELSTATPTEESMNGRSIETATTSEEGEQLVPPPSDPQDAEDHSK